MALVEIHPSGADEGETWHINPKQVTFIRPRKRFTVTHTEECADAEEQARINRCDAYALQMGGPEPKEPYGCEATEAESLTEICFANTTGAESSVFVTDTYDQVKARISEQT